MKSAAIIVNWNSWGHLQKCLESLIAQSIPFKKIIIIDNNSSDPMPGYMNNWLSRKEFILIPLEQNIGFAGANNKGVDLAHDCHWIALVNPDANLDRLWHEMMLNAVDRYSKAASFSSALVMEGDRRYWDGLGDVYHISGLIWRASHGMAIDLRAVTESVVFSPCAAAGFYRRDAFVQAGGFDEDFFCYAEDIDIGFRLRLLGFESVLIPEAIAYHVGSATTGGKHSDFAVYHGHRNLVWTFVKNMPGLLFWLFLPLHIGMNMITLAIFSLRGQGKVIAISKWDAIKGLPLTIRKRKVVQSSRRCSVADIWRILNKRLMTRKLRN